MRVDCLVIKEDLGDAITGGNITEPHTACIENVEIWEPGIPLYGDTLYLLSFQNLIQFEKTGCTAPFILTGCPAALPDTLAYPACSGLFLTAKETLPAEALYHSIRGILRRYSSWYQRMIDAVIGRKGQQELLDIAAEQLKNPLALFDTSWICLAVSGRDQIPEDDIIWKEVLSAGHVSVELSPVIKQNRSAFDKKDSLPVYHLFLQIGKKKISYLRANIFLKKELAGSICFTEILSPITVKTEILATQVCEIFSLMYQQTPVPPSNQKTLQSLFTRLIRGEHIETTYLENLVHSIGWNIHDTYCVYVIPLEQTSHELPYILRNLSCCLSSSQTLSQDHRMILIHNLSRSSLHPADELEKILHSLDLSAGASRLFDSLQYLRYYYAQAEAAASGRTHLPDRALLSFEEIEIFHILRTLDQNGTLAAYCLPEILKLASQDNSALTLIRTFYTYLSCGKNLIKSAQNMGVHRNTLVYRIQKINEIIGTNLCEQPDGMLKALLSCAILLYLTEARRS